MRGLDLNQRPSGYEPDSRTFFPIKRLGYLNKLDKIIKISRPGSPWRFTANELLTSYYIKNNDLNSAIQSLNIITEDNEAPPFMKERALLLLESIKEN